MSDIVLHHYPQSPFGEMVRLALGLKRLPWKSVVVPNILPKPDLEILTGGYARVPVLQIDADIYCDTAAIMDALEDHAPSPSLYPQPLGLAGRALALWAGGPVFTPAVGAALGPAKDMLPEEFWKDREGRFGMKKEQFLPMVPHLQQQFAAAMTLLEEILSDGRTFIGGEAPGHADLALYMLVWFQEMRGGKPADYGDRVAQWASRIAAGGHGSSTEWTADKALDLAKKSEPLHDCAVLPGAGLQVGDKVSVGPEGPDPGRVVGTLIGLDDRSITVERSHERVGKVHVHLPRIGQSILPVD
ncbi:MULTISPECIES: glutathione S-transferase family protein [Pacificimonas]|nr:MULTISPECIES: glutathione S-transferase family protein [Pacificimonas]MBZ6379462.1 glutathione S-transferase family protein [Pacificimonas aurantium]